MSFGFSIGDFIKIYELAKDITTACRDGPREFREVRAEIKALQTTLKRLCDDAAAEDSLLNKKGTARKQELLDIVANCGEVLWSVQEFIDKHSALEACEKRYVQEAPTDHSKPPEEPASVWPIYEFEQTNSSKKRKRATPIRRIWHARKVGSKDLTIVTGRLTFYVSCIAAFLQSLEGSTIVRIERKVDLIYQKLVQQDVDATASGFGGSATSARSGDTGSSASSNVSVAESVRSKLKTNEDDVWRDLKQALTENGIAIGDLATYKQDIIAYMKNKLDEELGGSSDAASSWVRSGHPQPKPEVGSSHAASSWLYSGSPQSKPEVGSSDVGWSWVHPAPPQPKYEGFVIMQSLQVGEYLNNAEEISANSTALTVRLAHFSTGWLGHHDCKGFIVVFELELPYWFILDSISFQIAAAPPPDLPNGDPYIPASTIYGKHIARHEGRRGSWDVSQGPVTNCRDTVVVCCSWERARSLVSSTHSEAAPRCVVGFIMAMSKTLPDSSTRPRLFFRSHRKYRNHAADRSASYAELPAGTFAKELDRDEIERAVNDVSRPWL